MAKVKSFISSLFSTETLGPPRGPAKVQWNKNSLELSWYRPFGAVSSNDLEYLVEIEQNGYWTTFGVCAESKVNYGTDTFRIDTTGIYQVSLIGSIL